MDIEEYAWNQHEQKLKIQQKEFQPSRPKIKIYDDIVLREELELKLEALPQSQLVDWALSVAIPFLAYLDEHLADDERIRLGVETLQKRKDGLIRAYDLRKVGFIVNQLAKESQSDISKYAARSFAQAIATGHMRGHAIVSSDYAVKVMNIIHGDVIQPATEERERQIQLVDSIGT